LCGLLEGYNTAKPFDLHSMPDHKTFFSEFEAFLADRQTSGYSFDIFIHG
jgi:hypothetical protein